MNITMLAIGSRGDVQPNIAVGKALKAKGHDVAILSSDDFSDLIRQHGLEPRPMGFNMQEEMVKDMGLIERSRNPVLLLQTFRRWHRQYGHLTGEAIWQASEHCDLLVTGITSNDYALAVAEKRAIPAVSMPLQPPQTPTTEGHVMIVAPFPRRSSRINLWVSRYFNQHSTWQMSGAAANRFRKSLGLKRDTPFSNARKRRAQLTINAYSRYLAPQPADWGDNNHTVGFCFLDQDSDWQPPSDLQAFLAAGSAPIYIGFGSMTDKDPAALTQMVIEVAQQSTERFILSSGWAKLGDQPLPENVFKIGNTPHSWLFPQMAAAVHHGGAGSTGASLRAGLPTQIVPFFADQPYWGRRVFEVGVGPKPIKRWRLTAQKLAQSIELMMTDQGLRARAAEMGRNISAENGATRAATIIDSILA